MPIMFGEAIKDAKWRITIDEKIASIEKNDTWKLVSRLRGTNPISVKWIFKEKKNAKEEVFDEVFALVTILETIQLIITTAAQYRWRIYQIDVKSSFLNGFLKKKRSTLSNMWDMKWRDLKTMY